MTVEKMPAMTTLTRRLRTLLATAAIATGFGAALPQHAAALTISLDFVTGPTTDVFAVGTTTATYGAYGFTGLSTAQIQISIYNAVVMDYLGFPDITANALSPLAAGKQLNLSFVTSSSAVAPGNGDPEYYHVAIGNSTAVQVFLGQACFTCVRTAGGVGPTGVSNGNIVGSILVDNIAGLASLATTDQQRINLLAGTVAHEIGHTLSLDHPLSATANPGASTFSLMATGASPTNMPNSDRILDRSFSYVEFSQLIGAVGVHDAQSVPEPASALILAFGGAIVMLRRRTART